MSGLELEHTGPPLSLAFLTGAATGGIQQKEEVGTLMMARSLLAAGILCNSLTEFLFFSFRYPVFIMG